MSRPPSSGKISVVHAAVHPVAGPREAGVESGHALADGDEVGGESDHVEVALLHHAAEGLQVEGAPFVVRRRCRGVFNSKLSYTHP